MPLFSFQSPSKRDANIDLFKEIDKSLETNYNWQKPAIFINPDVHKDLRKELEDIVKRHDGKIVGKTIFTLYEAIFIECHIIQMQRTQHLGFLNHY